MFQERKDEIVLLWRPHPLMESTLSAMRPQLYEQYMVVQDGGQTGHTCGK